MCKMNNWRDMYGTSVNHETIGPTTKIMKYTSSKIILLKFFRFQLFLHPQKKCGLPWILHKFMANVHEQRTWNEKETKYSFSLVFYWHIEESTGNLWNLMKWKECKLKPTTSETLYCNSSLWLFSWTFYYGQKQQILLPHSHVDMEKSYQIWLHIYILF